MTLPSSGSISTTQVRTEIGGSGAIVIPSADVRTLTGVASGSVVLPTDFYGKSWLTPAPSGTTLFTQSTAGSWSYTHSAYAAQNVTVELWAGGGGGGFTIISKVSYTLGGGGGGYTLDTYSIANGGTVSGSIGDGGAGNSGSTNSGTGGNSTCTQTAQTANGGQGAQGASGAVSGTGGTATGGTTNTTGTAGVTNSYGGGSPNGGANKTTAGVGNAPGGGGYGTGNAGAIGRVIVKAV